MLLGRTPVDGENYVEVLDGIRRMRPGEVDSAIRKRASGRLPRSLERICRRCLENDPAARYQSAEALAQDLRRCVAGEPISGETYGFWSRVAYWCQRPERIAEAGWFTIWIQVVWVIWVIGTDAFIRLSDVAISDADFGVIVRDSLFVVATVHAPLAYFGWKTTRGARWAPIATLGLTLLFMPGIFASVATEPVFFAPVYKGSTSWFIWAVYFMLITCFIFQIAYNACAVAASRRRAA